MNDLRKAAEMALEALERLDRWLALRYGNELTQPEKDVVEELRKALAHEESEVTRLRQVCRNVYEVWAGSEGIPMPETCAEGYLLQLVEQMRDEAKEGLPVDAVNMKQERVDETAKREHEPVAFRNTETGEFCTGGFLRKDWAKWQPLYAAPREWVGLDDDIPGLGLVTEEFYNGMLCAEDILRKKNT